MTTPKNTAFYNRQYADFEARTGTRPSPDAFDRAYAEAMEILGCRKADDPAVVDSFVEWYDYGRDYDGSALEVFERFRSPRAWVTLLAMEDEVAAEDLNP